MHLYLWQAFAGAIVGFTVGLTGMGGGALMTPILDAWKANPPKDFPNYAAGSWGPKCADELMTRDGHRWHTS